MAGDANLCKCMLALYALCRIHKLSADQYAEVVYCRCPSMSMRPSTQRWMCVCQKRGTLKTGRCPGCPFNKSEKGELNNYPVKGTHTATWLQSWVPSAAKRSVSVGNQPKVAQIRLINGLRLLLLLLPLLSRGPPMILKVGILRWQPTAAQAYFEYRLPHERQPRETLTLCYQWAIFEGWVQGNVARSNPGQIHRPKTLGNAC